MRNLSIVSVFLVGLGACGGSSGILGVIPLTPAPDYIHLDQRTSGGVSILGGKALIGGAPSTPSIVIRNLSGTLTHDNSYALTDFTVGLSVLTDLDGATDGAWTDGTTTVSVYSKPFADDYKFSGGFSLSDANGSGPMIVGVLTKPESIPMNGTATFSGDGFIEGSILGGDGTPIMSPGISTITANFGAGAKVSATLDGLETPSFDRIIISNMTISNDGTSFEGGNLSIFNGDKVVTADVMGSNQLFENQGNFFGGNTAGTEPAEAGGVFVMSGSDANIFGGYLGK